MKKLLRKLLGLDQPKYRINYVRHPTDSFFDLFFIERRVWLFWQQDGRPNDRGIWIPNSFFSKEAAQWWIDCQK